MEDKKESQLAPLSVFWCDLPNFGDAFNKSLFRHYGYEPVWSSPEKAEVLGVGSILSHVPQSFNGIVVGSGYREAKHRFHGLEPTFLALRGALTRSRTLVARSCLLGDFGILMPLVFQVKHAPSYSLGIIPHCMDADNLWLEEARAKENSEVLVIEPSRDPKEVLSDISKCAHIASASLHGLVAADAMGIPNCWIRLSDREVGKGFKFFDYFTSLHEFHLPLIPWFGMSVKNIIAHCQVPPSRVVDLQFELDDTMLNFNSFLDNHRDRASSKIHRAGKCFIRRSRRKWRHLIKAKPQMDRFFTGTKSD